MIRSALLVAVMCFAVPVFASDLTPPVITPNVSGTAGSNGYYTSDVTVSWTITDNESSPMIFAGCETTVITFDTSGTTLSCSALSLGGISTGTYTVRRDATAPVVSYTNAKATYDMTESVFIFCNAADATSGVASTDCQNIIGPATMFASTNVFSATATDFAGNVGTGSVMFNVVVTTAGLRVLVGQWVTNANDVRNLQKRLDRGDIDGFIRNVQREIGRSISPAHGAELIRLASMLL
jgi:hypothetical protein